ncbi:hypothetical protein, partial [Glutamicibacter protophormiae]|uniref:hypothetical protein n=1 Tax=Glutamicibacter protophormiae TaxID=37930 RepID=UPI003BAFFD18
MGIPAFVSWVQAIEVSLFANRIRSAAEPGKTPVSYVLTDQTLVNTPLREIHSIVRSTLRESSQALATLTDCNLS